MKEQGTVIEIKGNEAIVEIAPHDKCTKCCSCGAGKPRRFTVSGENAKGLAVGDRVEVDVATSSMMRVYLLLYGLPLVVFVAAVLLLYAIIGSPLISFTGALTATVAVYFALGFYARKSRGLSPKVTVTKV